MVAAPGVGHIDREVIFGGGKGIGGGGRGEEGEEQDKNETKTERGEYRFGYPGIYFFGTTMYHICKL
jgi:hypothetical protein